MALSSSHTCTWLVLVAVPACTTTAATYSPSATYSQPATCAQHNSAAGCTPDAAEFSCTGGATPEQHDPSLRCSDGTPDNGAIFYCCVTFAATSTCAADATVTGCGPSALGFSCTGGDTPEQNAPSLSCSRGIPGNAGSTLYCCVDATFSSSTCIADPTFAGCTGGSIGFSCDGTATPEQSDPSLVCSRGVAGAGGAILYCCGTGAGVTTVIPTCQADAAVNCSAGGAGYSCTGPETPAQDYPGLTCSAPIQANGATLYCCQ